MTPLRKKHETQAELTGLKALAAVTPREDPFGANLLGERIEALEQRLRALDEEVPRTPETEIFFGGAPVLGSDGIDAKFAAKMLDSFQDLVTNEFAASHGLLHRAGRRRGESDAKLFLTSLPRGSVGLQLAQPFVSDFVTAEHVAKAMAEVAALVEATAASDERFDEALTNYHPRVFKPLGRFLEAISSANAECRLVTGMQDVRLSHDQIVVALARVSETETEENPIEERGVFGGVLVLSRRFDFTTATGNVISGWLDESVSDDDAAAMAHFTGHAAVALMKTTLIQTRSGRKKPSYELVRLESPPEVQTLASVPVHQA